MAKRKSKKRRKATKRRGLTVGIKQGRSRKARRKSGFNRSLDTLKSALIASVGMRAGSGFVYGLMRKNNYDFPMSRVILPSVVAVAAGQGYIPVDGIFPVAVDQAFNGLVDTTDWLRNLMDWRFLDPKKPAANAPGQVAGASARQLVDTRNRINALNGTDYRRGLTVDASSMLAQAGFDDEGYRRE